jgi:hypothetical protein
VDGLPHGKEETVHLGGVVQLEFLLQIYSAMLDGQLGSRAAAHSSVMLAGHSRGGKLAALHYAAGDCHFGQLLGGMCLFWTCSPCS